MNASKVKWVRLGDCVESINLKVGDNIPKQIYGLHKDFGFIPTVANMTDIDTSKYNVVPSKSFGCNLMHVGRDITIPISFNYSSENLCISPAYLIFGVPKSKENEVLADYLSIIFQRSEFGRNAWLYTDNSIRGNLPEKAFWNMQIPLPSIEVQRELVDTYNGLKALAEQNEALIPRLSAACHAYIVDCRDKYPSVELGKYIEQSDKRNSDVCLTANDVQGISTDKCFIPTKANMDGVSVSSYKIVAPSEFVYVADTSRRGDKMALALNSSDKDILISSIYTVFRSVDDKVLLPEYLFLILNRPEFDRYSRFNSWGSARETFDWSEMKRVQIPLPPLEVQQAIVDVYQCLERAKQIATTAREKLKTLCPALVQRAVHS